MAGLCDSMTRLGSPQIVAKEDVGNTYEYPGKHDPRDFFLITTWGFLSGRQRQLIETVLPERVDSIVDVGCGPVTSFWILAGKYPDKLPVNYTGLDMDPDVFSLACDRWCYLRDISNSTTELDWEHYCERMATKIDIDGQTDLPSSYRLVARQMKHKLLEADFASLTSLARMEVLNIEDGRQDDPPFFYVQYKLPSDLDPEQTVRNFSFFNKRVGPKNVSQLQKAEFLVLVGLSEHEPEFSKFAKFVDSLANNVYPEMIVFSLLKQELRRSVVGRLQYYMSKMAVIFGANVPDLKYHANALEQVEKELDGYNWEEVRSFGARVLVVGKKKHG